MCLLPPPNILLLYSSNNYSRVKVSLTFAYFLVFHPHTWSICINYYGCRPIPWKLWRGIRVKNRSAICDPFCNLALHICSAHGPVTPPFCTFVLRFRSAHSICTFDLHIRSAHSICTFDLHIRSAPVQNELF